MLPLGDLLSACRMEPTPRVLPPIPREQVQTALDPTSLAAPVPIPQGRNPFPVGLPILAELPEISLGISFGERVLGQAFGSVFGSRNLVEIMSKQFCETS